jgi:hypothetical protein
MSRILYSMMYHAINGDECLAGHARDRTPVGDHGV